MTHIASWLVVAAALLSAPVHAAPADNEFSLGLGPLTYASFSRPSALFLTFEVAYHRQVATQGTWSNLRVGGGLRTTLSAAATAFPLEAFGQAELTARIGPWEPAAGPEVGVSGLARLRSDTVVPLAGSELTKDEDLLASPIYLAFGVSPLRFHFGNIVLSALELRIGTCIPHPGAVLRLQVGLLNFGIQL